MGCTNGKSFGGQETISKIQEIADKLSMISDKIEKANANFLTISDQSFHEQVILVITKINNDKIKTTSKKNILIQKQQEYLILMKQYQLSSKCYLTQAIKYIENYYERFYQTDLYITLNQLVQKLYKFAFSLELPCTNQMSNKSTFEEFGDLCESQVIS